MNTPNHITTRRAIQQLVDHIESLVRLHRGSPGTVTVAVPASEQATVEADLRKRLVERGLDRIRLIFSFTHGTPRITAYEFEP
jgi:hypothetical protein